MTNIHDKIFEFFESLELKVRTLLSYENLQKHRKDLYKFAQNELLSDTALLKEFCMKYCYVRTAVPTDKEDEDDFNIVLEVGEKLVNACVHLEYILKFTVNLFLSVCISQFRKDYLTAIRRE